MSAAARPARRKSDAPQMRVTAQRLTSQLLAGAPERDPVAVAKRLLAIQGQDPRGARLAIRARSQGLSGADVDRALSEDRSLLITWCNRGTLHLIASDDYHLLHSLTTPQLVGGCLGRLVQTGVSADAAERGVKVIERALADSGPLTRLQLRDRLRRARVPTEGQALVHVLMLATLRGVSVRGPMVGRQHAYALVRDWLPAPQARPPGRERGLAELARRYLAGHAPADDRDLAKWAGLPLRDARAGLTALGTGLTRRADGLLELRGTPEAAELPPPRLLGSFEPVLLGWARREALIGPEPGWIVNGGMFRAFAMVDGRAVAVWKLSGRRVELEPHGRLTAKATRALEADARALTDYLGLGAAPMRPPIE